MCILCFHAWAGYLQTYETLLKEINMHPGSAPDDDQFLVESVALSDSNFNLACETGIRYPKLVSLRVEGPNDGPERVAGVNLKC